MLDISRKIVSRTFDTTIRSIRNERRQFDNYPAFQRGKVWPKTMQQMLIDSVLRGFPIGSLLIYEGPKHEWEVVDGQQRLSALLDFCAGDFMTISEHGLREMEPQLLSPIEPGKRFNQLTNDSQNQILNYSIHFMQVDTNDPIELGVMFRRLQMEVPLRMAEKLASYSSHAKDIAMELTHHPFFSGCYSGGRKHQEMLHMTLYLLEMSRAGFPTNLEKAALVKLTSGVLDDVLTTSLIQDIEISLYNMLNLYAGIQMKAKTDMIAVWQSYKKLEVAGYDLERSNKGCLAPLVSRSQGCEIV